MPTIIKGRFGIGYRQSPYLYNILGFKVVIAEGNMFERVEVKTNYVKFFEQGILDVNIRLEGNDYIASNDDLGLLAVGKSLDDAVDEIKEEFCDLWKEYVDCPDEELTEDAKELRAKLRKYKI
jgi:predicted RNase H-like HicB family nuclease